MTLLDQEIAHITHAMRFSICRDAGASILPAGYWRQRLYRLLDSGHVTKAQLCATDTLLLELDVCEKFDGRSGPVSHCFCGQRP